MAKRDKDKVSPPSTPRRVSEKPLGPDLVLLNGKVLTAEKGARHAQALAIAGQRVLAVGTTAEIAAMGLRARQAST